MTCLFCKQEREESVEHVFARPIGRLTFTVRFVCGPCNSQLGKTVDPLADRVARLTHARESAKLPVRGQAIRQTEPVIEGDGKNLKTQFDRHLGAAVVLPQPDGDAMIVGRDRMGPIIREMTADKFKADGQTISREELNQIVKEALDQYDAAETGAVIKIKYRGAVLEFDRREVTRDKAPAERHDEPGAINRLSAKIAFEIAAHVNGVEPFLHNDFDNFRNWVLTGEPDLGATAIEIVREPALEGGDALKQHTVRLEEVGGVLFADIDYYDAYRIKVRVGPGVGMLHPWARRFQIEPEDGEVSGVLKI